MIPASTAVARADAIALTGRVVPKFLSKGMRVLAFGGPVTAQSGDMQITIPAGSWAVLSGYCRFYGDGAEMVLEVLR